MIDFAAPTTTPAGRIPARHPTSGLCDAPDLCRQLACSTSHPIVWALLCSGMQRWEWSYQDKAHFEGLEVRQVARSIISR